MDSCTGRGVNVAVLDTGMYPHPDYRDRIIKFVDFVGRKDAAYDDNGHGTHVTGIIAGDGRMSAGKYKGIAAGCGLIGLKVLDRSGCGNKEDLLKAFRWISLYREKFHIRIVNISVGTTYQSKEEHTILNNAVEKLWDEGLVVVAAAGNKGPAAGSVTAPGCSKKIITVGSSDMLSGKNASSGRGPTFECVCKPDLVAPGNQIISCIPPGKTEGIRYQMISKRLSDLPPNAMENMYGRKSGTSMSTPQISGAIALALEKDPYLTNVEIKMILKECCDDMGFPKNEQGWGCFNIKKLMKLV